MRTRILRAFASRGLIERFEAREMLAFKHSGFSVNAGVCIQAQDRAALERLRQRGAELVYHYPKPQSGGKQADLVLNRYYGVLAPNAPLRAVVTAMAQAGPAQGGVGQSGRTTCGRC